MTPGFAFDLNTLDPVDGKPWDFSNPIKRERAERTVLEEKPFLLVGSPPCRAFNQIFSSNISRMNPEVVKSIVREGVVHLLFSIELYRIQLQGGRYFLHEHPWTATSWELREMQKFMSQEGLCYSRGDMCVFGMTSKDDLGEGLVMKPTGWLSNSWFIAEEVGRQCSNKVMYSDIAPHRHVHLISGKARACQRQRQMRMPRRRQRQRQRDGIPRSWCAHTR